MPELVANATSRTEITYDRHQIGSRVLISRGPLKGLSGFIAELAGEEVLVDLSSSIDGLLVRCRRQHLEIDP